MRIGNVTACAGDSVIVPIYFSGFNQPNVGAVSMIVYNSDTTVLGYRGYKDVHSSFPSCMVSADRAAAFDTIRFGLYSSGGCNTANGTLLKLIFIYKSSGTVNLSFETDYLKNIDISDVSFNPYSVTWQDGGVSIGNQPIAVSATASSTLLCIGNTLNLYGSSVNATSWNWIGPNGFLSNAQNPEITNVLTTNSGVYTLSAINGCGTTTTTTSSIVIKNTTPTLVSASSSATEYCIGNSVALTGNATDVTSWAWVGPNFFSSSVQNPIISNISTSGAGIYTVYATNVCGYTTATTNSLIVYSSVPSSVTAAASASSLCLGNYLTLSGSAINATGWSWSGPNSYSSNSQSPSALSINTTNQSGIYTLSATNACGTSTAATSNVAVYSTVPQSVNIIATPNAVCMGGNLNLSGTATNADSWSWAGPGGYTSTQNPTVCSISTSSQGGIYTLSAINSCGTTTSNSSIISVSSSLAANPIASVSSTSLCVGGTLTLTGSAANATSWSWTGPDGFSSTDLNPATITNVTTAKAGIYTLTAVNGCGTMTSQTQAVVVNSGSPVSVAASVSSTELCAGNSLTLTGTATNATNWSWAGPNLFTSTLQSPVISSVTTAMEGVYTLSAINGCGTTAANSSAVIISTTSPVSVTAVVSSTSLCVGNSLTLTGTATNATSWSWAGPNLFTSTLQSPVISSVTTAMEGVYTLSAINSCGTTTAQTSAVVINSASPVSVTAGASSTLLCAGNSLTLTGTATNTTSWSWDGPNFYTSTIQSPLISSVTTAMAGVYTLSAINGCGFTTAITTPVTIYTGAPTSANASESSTAPCLGSVLTLTGSATNATSWSWSGPNTYSSTQNPAMVSISTTSQSGIYTLSAINACGTTTAVTGTISVSSSLAPSVSASALSTSLCVLGDLELLGTITNATTWSWSGPDGFSSTAQNPLIIQVGTENAGVYTLSAVNACGTMTAQTSSIIINTDVPTGATASASSNSLCSGNNLILTGQATNATSWSWSGPNGFSSILQTAIRTNVSTSDAGIYTLSAVNGCGNALAITENVIINTTVPSSVSATTSGIDYCIGSTLILDGQAVNATSWHWNGPNGFSSTQQTPSILSLSTADVGIYTLTAINGCGSGFATTGSILINTWLPSQLIASASSTALCLGNTLTLTGTAQQGTSWSWSGPNGFSATVQNPATINITTTAQAGIYTMNVTNACGTTTSTTSGLAVYSNTPTSVTASASPTTLSYGSLLTLTGSATNATSWSWSGPNTYSSSAQNPTSITITTTAQAGIYKINAMNACGASSALTDTVKVAYQNPSGLTATATPNPIAAGDNLQLTATITDPGVFTGITGDPGADDELQWTWSGPDGFTSTQQNPVITAVTTADAGVYTVKVCNAFGCTTALTDTVKVAYQNPSGLTATATPNPIAAGDNLQLTATI
ncbi:MAG: hypothetical protein WCM76_16455, partial [Bacteroidota bacterium]